MMIRYKAQGTRYKVQGARFRICVLAVLFLFISNINLISAQGTAVNGKSASNDYDEVLITLNVPRIGSVEIPAVIYEDMAYLPVREFFDFLRIKNSLSADLSTIQGFFVDPKATYTISKNNKQIIYEGKRFDLQSTDIIVIGTDFYLRSALYGPIFGLNCQFNFRSLSINLSTDIELPAIREMKLESMRKNVNLLKGEKKADTILRRSFSLFRLGTLDWFVMSTSESNMQRNTRVSLGLGAMLAGGEANFFLNLYNDHPFKLKEQYYFWRYVNNAHPLLRQVTVGKILANPSSTVYDGITGIQINNIPTTYRRSFGTYTLSDKTEPGWTVELYVNNVLVNYTKADASGFFTFEVPLVYGSSAVKLRYYGPYGEERTHEENLSIPFNFLPQHQLEYNLNAGIVEDDKKSKFSRAQVSYGINQRITVGAGMEYLSSVSDKVMPFVTASVRLGNNIFFNAEHIQGVRSKGLLSFHLPSNVKVEVNYLHYDKDQKAVNINYLEEKKLVISKPFRGDKYSVYSRLTLSRFTLANADKKSQYTTGELLISAVAYGISANLTNYAIFKEPGIPLAYSNLSMTFYLPHGFHLLPQAQYEYTTHQFSRLKAEVEKSIFHRGYLNLSYEKDLTSDNYIAGIGLRYNLSFSQASFASRRSKQSTTMTEVVRGSVLYDNKTNYIGLNDQSNVGKGGLIVAPYLDLNCNNKRDPNEPAAPGLKLKINGGHVKRNDKDTTIRVTGLEAYTNYYLELDKNCFDNVAWQIHKPTIQLNINPNHFTYLEIPVSVVGELSGMVYLQGNNGPNGLGRIIVNIYDKDSAVVARTITEGDGFFNFMGLAPGDYFIKVDPGQLSKLNMQVSVPFIKAHLAPSKDGSAVSGLVFNLTSNNKNNE